MKKERKVRVITVFTVLCGSIALICTFSKQLLALYLARKFNIDTKNASSVGIIGSADGPTAIFVSGQSFKHWFTAASSVLTILGILYLVFNQYKEKQR